MIFVFESPVPTRVIVYPNLACAVLSRVRDDGPNDAIAAFPAAAAELAGARSVEPRSEPGFDYWMVFRRGEPQWVFERSSARVWTYKGSKPADLMKLYDRSGRDVHLTVLALLRSLSTALSSASATESDALFG